MKLIFAGKTAEADGAFSFRFKPAEPLAWVAGQSIKIELPAGYATAERRFTIAAAPLEKDIIITTRVNPGEFKQALDALLPGDEVTAHSIDGNFVWREADASHTFVAGGIGITPFYAMLRQRALEEKPLNATLLYAARGTDFVFGRWLQKIAKHHPEFAVIFWPEQPVDAQKILAHSPTGLVYLSGPSRMVDDVGANLLAANFPEEKLVRDWFLGTRGWEDI